MDGREKRDREERGGSWIFGHGAYQRHFEGYIKVQVPKPNGKGTRTEYVYTGEYYQQDLAPRQRVWLRVLYALLFVAAAALFLWAALARVPSNTFWLVAVFEAAGIVLLAWALIALLGYLPKTRELTIGEYNGGPRAVRRASLAAGIALAATAIAVVAYAAFGGRGETGRELLAAARFLLASGCMAALYLTEKRLRYTTRPSPNRPPEGGEGTR